MIRLAIAGGGMGWESPRTGRCDTFLERLSQIAKDHACALPASESDCCCPHGHVAGCADLFLAGNLIARYFFMCCRSDRRGDKGIHVENLELTPGAVIAGVCTSVA